MDNPRQAPQLVAGRLYRMGPEWAPRQWTRSPSQAEEPLVQSLAPGWTLVMEFEGLELARYKAA